VKSAAALIISLLLGVATAAQSPSLRAPLPQPALDGVLEALRGNQLVAISDPHGSAAMHDFLRRLFADARFAELGVDLILEVGNARYQPVVDAYVNGEVISEQALAEAWLNTTVPNQIHADVEWFRQMRRINAGRPADRRVRILLGDPPIDWSQVQTRADHFTWLALRDSYPAALIQTEIIGRQRKGLIVYGHLHFQRRNVGSNFEAGDWRTETIVSLIERAGPTRVFTIWRLEEPLLAVLPEAAKWPIPAFAPVAGTTLGAADVGRLTTFPTQRFRLVDGATQIVTKDQYATLAIERQLDAVLRLGAEPLMPMVQSAAPCKQAGFLEERLRRIALTGLPKFEADNVRKLCAAEPR
jgi:hypothetical protein